jgi:hypothetical protein
MRKPTSSTQLAAFLFVDSRWHEPHDAVQCRAHGSTFEFLFEFQTEFFSNFLFEFQVVRESNRSTFEGPLYFNIQITSRHQLIIRINLFFPQLPCYCHVTFYTNKSFINKICMFLGYLTLRPNIDPTSTIIDIGRMLLTF